MRSNWICKISLQKWLPPLRFNWHLQMHRAFILGLPVPGCIGITRTSDEGKKRWLQSLTYVVSWLEMFTVQVQVPVRFSGRFLVCDRSKLIAMIRTKKILLTAIMVLCTRGRGVYENKRKRLVNFRLETVTVYIVNW